MRKEIGGEIIGGIGSFIILLSFFLLNFEYLLAEGLVYQGMNVVGSACFVYSAFVKGAKQPMYLNIMWIVAALIAIGRVVL